MIVTKDTQNQTNTNSIFELPSVSVTKQILSLLLIISIPLFIMVNQTKQSLQSNLENKMNAELSRLEKQASKLAQQANISKQAKKLLNQYMSEFWKLYLQNRYLTDTLQSYGSFFPGMANFLKYNSSFHFNSEMKKIEQGLRRLIPGIKIIMWDETYKVLKRSDKLRPAWPYKNFVMVRKLKTIDRYNSQQLRSNEHYISFTRYIEKEANCKQLFNSSSEVHPLYTRSGRDCLFYWQEINIINLFNSTTNPRFGVLFEIDVSKIPQLFDAYTIRLFKKSSWQTSNKTFGWINPSNASDTFLPNINRKTKAKWFNWIKKLPTGGYERNGHLVAVNRVRKDLVFICYKRYSHLTQEYNKKFFLLVFFLFILVLLPIFTVIKFRKNNGIALSIRFQILGLFILTIGFPTFAVYQFGTELIKYKKAAYEENAYKKLEKLQTNFDDNYQLAFDELRLSGDRLTKLLSKSKFNFSHKQNFEKPQLKQLIEDYRDKYEVTNLYIFNSSAEVLVASTRNEDSDNLLHLLSSFAKLKLIGIEKFKVKAGRLVDSMFGYILEQTGGNSINAFRAIFKSNTSEAFDLSFSKRRLNVYLNTFYQKNIPGKKDEIYVILAVARDSHFERLFIRQMVKNVLSNKNTINPIQVFFAASDAVHNRNPFIETCLETKSAWFNYKEICRDTQTVYKEAEATQYTRAKNRSIVHLGEKKKKYLFHSFVPTRVNFHYIVSLFDYSIIEEQINELKKDIISIFILSLIISILLARIAARSLIAPINLLKVGVNNIQAGDYSTILQMPGRDELVDLAGAFNSMAVGLSEREKMTKYLSKAAVESVKKDSNTLMGGKKIAAAILFSDIRSFTTMSEAHSAEEVVAVLNEYFACMNAVIEENGGDIDKFIGDAIMAQFISPNIDISNEGLSDKELAENAVKCGLAMMTALSGFNEKRKAKGLFPLAIGVGINFGNVIAGNIGSPGRMDHTVIGDTVNVASRLEGMSKKGKHTNIIISQKTLELVCDKIEYEKLEESSVKGKTQIVEMFEVICWK